MAGSDSKNFLRHWPWLILLLLPLIPLGPIIFSGKVIGPFDQILAMAPWSKSVPAGQAWDVLQADSVLQFYPWRTLVLESWGRFEIPWWNPYQLMGAPLLANSQSGALYPLHILFGILRIPVGLAINLLAWFHLAWFGMGIFTLVRRLGGSDEGAFFGGAAGILSPWLLAWTPLASVPTTVSWIPWVLVGVVLAREQIVRGGLAAGLACACMILAGHLQFAAYGFLAAGVLAIVLAVQGRNWQTAIGFGLAVVFGAGLSMMHLGPVLEAGQTSHRRGSPTAEGYGAYVAGGLSTPDLAGAVYPTLAGLPGRPVAVGEAQLPSYWPAYQRRGASFPEGSLALGALVLMLAFRGFWRRQFGKESLAFLIIAGLGLLLAFGSPLNMILYYLAPGWSATGSPGRVLSVVLISLFVAAGLAWPRSKVDGFDRRDFIAFGLFGAAGLALPVVLAGGASWIPGFDASTVAMAQIRSGFSMALGSLIAGGLALYFWGRGQIQIGLAAALAGQLLLSDPFLGGVIPSGKPDFTADLGIAPHERVAFVNDNWSLLERAPALMPPNMASLLKVRDVAGYDSLIHRETVEKLKDAVGQDPAPPANGNVMLIKPGFDEAKLAALGVSTVIDQNGPRKIAGPGRADIEGRPVTWIQDGPQRIELEVEEPGLLTLRDRYSSRWIAEIDGRKLDQKESFFRQVEVPDGKSRVVFRVQNGASHPWLVMFGSIFAMVAAMLLLIWENLPRVQHENETPG